MSEYEIRDPVYGFITFNEWEKEIIDHFVFQRLRRIKQLALTDMVYPGATHTRFEHSLGVMHLATKMYDAIIRDDSNKQLLTEKLNYQESGLKRDRQLVRLAALLHDVGHAPFSHASEAIISKNPVTGKPYKHEDYTSVLIKGPLRTVIEDHSINKTNFSITADEIAALIEGNPEILGERVFWRLIISSQLDADRGDYLLRDSLHCGVKYGIYDLDRLLVTTTLGIDPETEDVILGVTEGGWHVAESLVIARYQMFSQIYFHKTRRAYDHMLQEAIKNAIGTLPTPDEIQKYLELDDYEVWHQLKNKENDFWYGSIVSRNHIRKVFSIEEVSTSQDVAVLDKIKTEFDEKDIWYWEDVAKKEWYKMNSDGAGKEEIMIIGDRKGVTPLQKYSRIVKNIGESMRYRLYVKPNDREGAETIIKEVKG